MIGQTQLCMSALGHLDAFALDIPADLAYLRTLAVAAHERLGADPLDGIDALIEKRATPSKILDALETAATRRATLEGLQSLSSDYLARVARLAGIAIVGVADDILTQLQPVFAENVDGYRQAIQPIGGSIDLPKQALGIPAVTAARDEAIGHLNVLRQIEALHTDLERLGYQVHPSYRWTAHHSFPRVGGIGSVLEEIDVPLHLNTKAEAQTLADAARAEAEAEQARIRGDRRAAGQAWAARRDALAKLS